MSGHIPKSFIDELLNRVDIVELISTRVNLRKRGNNYVACCPFHQEKTPSFSVSSTKQFYHCFGCGQSGNAIGFIMNFDGLNFVDAIESLSEFIGVSVPYEYRHQQTAPDITDSDYELMAQIAQFYQQQLRAYPPAIDYLKKRGLSGNIAKEFAIGYAPPGWDHLVNTFVKTEESKEQLVRLGMIIKNDQNRYYDRFRDRIMFPIKDQRGRVIAFGGRVIDAAEPKYLNSPETHLYHKSDALYGFYECKKTQRKISKLIVVEGYLDVIALFQYEIPFAVATCGTATTAEHLKRLLRNCEELIFCFDGDRAGRQAATRALTTALPIIPDNKLIRFLFLANDADPDSFLRAQGRDGFLQQLEHAIPLSEFFFEHLENQVTSRDREGMAHLAKLAADYLKPMPDTILKTILLEELAKRLGMDILKLQRFIEPDPFKIPEPETAVATNKPSPHLLSLPIRTALTILIQYPQLIQQIEHLDYFLTIKQPDLTLLQQVLKTLQQQQFNTTAHLLEYWRNHSDQELLTQLASHELLIPADGLAQELNDTLQKLIHIHKNQEIDQLMMKAMRGELAIDEKQRLQQLIQAQKKPATT
ncbi:MAG: DNA primase [Legionellales bacterium]|nr:DNA primase [Legionellales bacterium]